MPKSKNNRKGKERKNRKRNLERFRKELHDRRNPGNNFAKSIAAMQAAAALASSIEQPDAVSEDGDTTDIKTNEST